jgi:hypothetical protein
MIIRMEFNSMIPNGDLENSGYQTMAFFSLRTNTFFSICAYDGLHLRALPVL